MVTARLIDIDIPASIQHISTDWDIATDRLFENIVCTSREDAVNKTAIKFNEVLDPSVKYYGRARILLSTGPTFWGNIDVFVPVSYNDKTIDINPPSMVSTPNLSLSESLNSHSLTGFRVYANGFNATSDAIHSDTSWFLEELNGVLLWSSVHDTYNKTSVGVYTRVLKANHAYRIRCVFHSSSNDSTQVTSKTFTTRGENEITLDSFLYNIKAGVDLDIMLKPNHKANSIDWVLYSLESNSLVKIWDTKTTGDEMSHSTLPSELLIDNKVYVLKVKADNDKHQSVYSFTTATY